MAIGNSKYYIISKDLYQALLSYFLYLYLLFVLLPVKNSTLIQFFKYRYFEIDHWEMILQNNCKELLFLAIGCKWFSETYVRNCTSLSNDRLTCLNAKEI